MTYRPKPIDLSEIVLSDEIMELIEHLAENTHKVWAQARMNEGWTYGEKRDDGKSDKFGFRQSSFEKYTKILKEAKIIQ